MMMMMMMSSNVQSLGELSLVLMLRAWPRFDVKGNDVTGSHMTGSDPKPEVTCFRIGNR